MERALMATTGGLNDSIVINRSRSGHLWSPALNIVAENCSPAERSDAGVLPRAAPESVLTHLVRATHLSRDIVAEICSSAERSDAGVLPRAAPGVGATN